MYACARDIEGNRVGPCSVVRIRDCLAKRAGSGVGGASNAESSGVGDPQA